MPAHPGRSASAKPGTSSGGWSRRTPPARRLRDENRAPDTLVDATSCAIADAGSIPAVSTVWLGDGASGALFGGNTWCLVLEPLRVRLHRRLKVRVVTVPVDPERRGEVRMAERVRCSAMPATRRSSMAKVWRAWCMFGPDVTPGGNALPIPLVQVVSQTGHTGANMRSCRSRAARTPDSSAPFRHATSPSSSRPLQSSRRPAGRLLMHPNTSDSCSLDEAPGTRYGRHGGVTRSA
jgi:hypothetical protein